MSNNITLNIVEPGSPTPDPVVPNTGLFTSGIGGPEATAIGAVLILTIVAIVVAFLYRKQKKSGKVTKLVHLVDSTKAVLKSKKRVTVGLTALALLASAGTLTTLLASAGKSNTNAIDGEAMAEAETITPTVSGNELTVELGSEPVFAILPVDITVEQATEAGYTLTAYTDNTDLISTTDSSKVIPMVAVEGDELTSLTDNTYGLSLVQPESKDDEVYTSLSTDQDNPTFITDKDYEPTEANDTTTIYYAFYITPDTPYGTYTGSDINYTVEANRSDLATVTFNGNGLSFDNGKTTNVIKYIPNSDDAKYDAMYSHTPNISDAGIQNGSFATNLNTNEVVTIPGAASLSVKLNYGSYGKSFGYVSFWEGAFPNYRANSDSGNEYGVKKCGSVETDDGKFFGNDANSYNTVQCTISGNAVTFGFWSAGGGPSNMGYGYYAVVTGYDENGNIIDVVGYGNEILTGDYNIPVVPTSSEFLGWDTDPNAGSPAYISKDEITGNLPLSIGDNITLYAIWTPAPFNISYDGNNATAGSMQSTTGSETVTLSHSNVSRGTTIDLYAPNYKKTGYGFVGWSADNNAWTHLTDNDPTNDPKIYGPNQTIYVDGYIVKGINSTTNTSTLYAVWAPAETNITMQTFDPTNQTYVSKPIGSVMALKDARDNEVYTVAKLADGNWWMIENLRLDDSATLTKDNGEIKGNTNNPNLPLTNSTSGPVTSNKLSATSNSWCAYGSPNCVDQSYLNTNNTNLGVQGLVASYNENGDNVQWYSYGNYYDWYSATAGNGTSSVSSGTVAGDLCPAGWKLPIGKSTSDNGSFSHLDVAMGGTGQYQNTAAASNRWRSFPNNFVYSGYWYGSSASNRGFYGYYWSSTAFNTDGAYNLLFYSGNVYPGTDNGNKYSGYSVRCVAPTE